MIKPKRIILLLVAAIFAIVILRDLSAQVYENKFQSNVGQQLQADYSKFSNNRIEAKATFNVFANVAESLTTVELHQDSEGSSTKKLGLSISPARLVFENGVKTAEITMTNIGNCSTLYYILLVNTVFDETGNRTIIEPAMQADFEKHGALFADKMLKFAPRYVRLKPTEQQLIRVATVIPDKLEDGEYRSELKFSWKHDSEELVTRGSLEESLEQSTASATEPIIDENTDIKGIYIPLIIRQGNLSATAQLAQLQLESSDEATVLNLKIFREGNRSIYGDLLIFGLNKQNEKTEILHTVSNVAIYPPSLHRDLSVDLTEALSKDGKNIESLMIEYKAKGNEDNNVIASSAIKLLNGARASAE